VPSGSYDSGRNKPALLAFVMAMGKPNKTMDEYRQLAQKFREIARMTLGEDERRRLLEVAQTWDLIAERVGRAAHYVGASAPMV
jgi:ABC-type phosphonate transport system ATPase subunit